MALACQLANKFAMNNIRVLRKQREMTLEALAERTGISTSHLSRMESGARGISMENAMVLASAFGVQLKDIRADLTPEDFDKAQEMLDAVRELRKATAATEPEFLASDYVGGTATVSSVNGRQGLPLDSVPEIDVTGGLGGGGFTVDAITAHGKMTFAAEVVRDHWRIPDWLFAKWNVKPAYVAAFPVQGDSMMPTLNDGDVVFFDTRHRVPSPPGLYAVVDEFGGVIVKRLEVVSRPADEVVMIAVMSDNQRHSTRTLAFDEIHIIGRYLGRFTF